MSAILGIIEEDTGKCHFWNAEHPFQILYRDGKTNYMENSVSMNKIGFVGEADLFILRESQRTISP